MAQRGQLEVPKPEEGREEDLGLVGSAVCNSVLIHVADLRGLQLHSAGAHISDMLSLVQIGHVKWLPG